MPRKPNYEQEEFDAGRTLENEQDEDDFELQAEQDEQDEPDEEEYIPPVSPSQRRYLNQNIGSSITKKQVTTWNKATKKQLKVK